MPHLTELLLLLAVLIQVAAQVGSHGVVEVLGEVRVVDGLLGLVVVPEDVT